METTDLIIGVVSAVALLLLLLTAVCDLAPSGYPQACRHSAQRRPITAGREDHDVASSTSHCEERCVWLIRPGAEIVDGVPAEVQAEALGALDTLGYLDECFAEAPHTIEDPR